MATPQLVPSFSLGDAKTWAIAKGVGVGQKTTPGLDVVGLTVETVVSGLLREVVTAGQQRAWVAARRAWQLDESLPAAVAPSVAPRF